LLAGEILRDLKDQSKLLSNFDTNGLHKTQIESLKEAISQAETTIVNKTTIPASLLEALNDAKEVADELIDKLSYTQHM